MSIRIDTGADVTSVSTQVLLSLGIKEDPSDERVETTAANGQVVSARRKNVLIRIAGFPEAFPIPIHYSAFFRPDLAVISLGAITQLFGVVMTNEFTVLFPL